MKADKLKAYILEAYPNLDVSIHNVCERAIIHLEDGGRIEIGIHDKSRRVKSSFLFFNIKCSPLRLSCSSSNNGKYNYFGNEPLIRLDNLLKELKTLIEP